MSESNVSRSILRITGKQVVDAYQKTGMFVKHNAYFTAPDKADKLEQCAACALTALAVASRPGEFKFDAGAYFNSLFIRKVVAQDFLGHVGDLKTGTPMDAWLDGFTNGFDTHSCNIEFYCDTDRKQMVWQQQYCLGYANGAAVNYEVSRAYQLKHL